MEPEVPTLNYLIENTASYKEGSTVFVSELQTSFTLLEGSWLQYIEELL
jgi:hypothetical protein